MKKINVLLTVLILSFIITSPAWSQIRNRYRSPEIFHRNSVFLLLGYSQGPSFKQFVEWANNYYYETYGSSDSISDFSGNIDFSAGIRLRFSRHFASEFDFLTYSLKTSERFTGRDGANINQILELNVAIVSASIMILFDFSSSRSNQLIVPFIATGISIFPLRLDHNYFRFTNTSLAANFATGLDVQISRKLWAEIRADWTLGKTNVDVAHPPGQPTSFELDLSTMQLQAGIMYGFH